MSNGSAAAADKSAYRKPIQRIAQTLAKPCIALCGRPHLKRCTGRAKTAALAQQSYREFRNPRNASCRRAAKAPVVAVAGPQTLHLADGRFVRLAEIMVPPPAATGLRSIRGGSAYLRQAALGRKVEVKFGGQQRDRYGIYTGHIFVGGRG